MHASTHTHLCTYIRNLRFSHHTYVHHFHTIESSSINSVIVNLPDHNQAISPRLANSAQNNDSALVTRVANSGRQSPRSHTFTTPRTVLEEQKQARSKAYSTPHRPPGTQPKVCELSLLHANIICAQVCPQLTRYLTTVGSSCVESKVQFVV